MFCLVLLFGFWYHRNTLVGVDSLALVNMVNLVFLVNVVTPHDTNKWCGVLVNVATRYHSMWGGQCEDRVTD